MVKRERGTTEDAPNDNSAFKAFYLEKKKALAIDRNALDDEWAEHATHYQDVAEYLTNLTGLRDRQKEELRELEGQLDPQVRARLERDEIKITEAAVKAAVSEDKAVVRKRLAIVDLDYQISLLSGLRESFAQRRYALQGLESLWLGSYWATPNHKPRTYENARSALQEERVKKRK